MQTDKTVDSCFILPIRSHKIGNARDLWDDVSEKFREDAQGQLKGVGIKRLLVFLQAIPDKGDYMVVFMQAKNGLEKTLKDMLATGSEYTKYLKEQIQDISGMDLSKEENVPKIQLLMDWKDAHMFLEEKEMLKMPWSFTMPIQPGKTDDMLKMMKDVKQSRMGDVENLLRHHDIVRSLTYLQHTQQGDFIVRHILASNPLDEIIASFTTCKDKMCVDIRKVASEFFGVDISDTKNLPHVELLFKWDDKHGFETADQVIAYTE